MNKIFMIFLMSVIILTANFCTTQNQKKAGEKFETSSPDENFDWLVGHWKRTNEEEGKETFEEWRKNGRHEYYGLGFTIQNNDTLNRENIRLLKTGNKWILKVQSPDEIAPVIFTMTSHNDDEFICENKEIDFPKMIRYRKDGEKLNALVSGDDMEITFEFERISK